MVANKVDGGDDGDRIARRLGRPVAAAVPIDGGVAVADRRAVAPLDAAPDGGLVAAVAGLVQQVRSLYPLDQAPERLGRRVIG